MSYQKAAETMQNLAGPVLTTATGALTSALVAANTLPALGFTAAGIKAGSIAAAAQSGLFGGAVPVGGWFATMTSWGATGVVVGPAVGVAAPVGAVVAGVGWWYFKG